MDLRFFEIYRNPDYLILLGKGALLSASLTVLAALFGLVIAFILAAIRYGQVPVLKWIAAAYVEFIRNTPLIVQLFFIAFGLPMLLGYEWPFWAHALLSLSINFSGYFAEILRAGLDGTGMGQREAARARGRASVGRPGRPELRTRQRHPVDRPEDELTADCERARPVDFVHRLGHHR